MIGQKKTKNIAYISNPIDPKKILILFVINLGIIVVLQYKW